MIWTPVAVDRVHPEDEWYVLRCRRFDDGAFFRLLSAAPIEGIVRAPALLSPMTKSGFATISYLSIDGSAHEGSVYDYGTHCLSSPATVERDRAAHTSGVASGNESVAVVDGL
jgi:hypothetical protein